MESPTTPHVPLELYFQTLNRNSKYTKLKLINDMVPVDQNTYYICYFVSNLRIFVNRLGIVSGFK